MPTIALSNSVAFAQMTDAGKQFPWIRVFGTLGWIAAGLIISQLGIEKTAGTFQVAAGVSIVLGLLFFALPNTPPKGKGEKANALAILGTDAFVLFKTRSFSIFFISAILICIPLSFYYGFANPFLNEIGLENVAGKMTMGQMSEAIFILAIPFLFNKIGVKKMLILGMSAWVLRYICFAYGNLDASWMLYAGIILHGVCYDFFFVSGQIYTEQKAGRDIKAAAQGLITLATYGVGMLLGFRLAGYITDLHHSDSGYQWWQIWLIPAGIAALVLVVFVLSFPKQRRLSV